ncbi:MAG TPA: CAP domain-containing protein [Acidimicrobiales bacterium]|nr:CAP domain-containing protein [Acidimicrobiales bacterium]
MRRLRSFRVVAAGGLMLAILAAAEMSQAVAEGFLTGEENHMTDLVNDHRSEHALGSLQPDPALQMVARRQAQRMSAAGYIYHNPNLGNEAGSAVPSWLRVGENVGVGPSVVAVEDAFLASPPHHANLDKTYDLIGLGAVAARKGSLFFAQNFAQSRAVAPTPLPPSAPGPAPAPQDGPSPGRPARPPGERGPEIIRPTPDSSGQPGSGVGMARTVLSMLGQAADKATFWN